jgi:hypothetical protein
LQDWYRDGIPIWWDESDRVGFEAQARISKSRAAIERAQESASKNKKSVPGKYFVANPILIEGDEMPTREEWLLEQEEKRGHNVYNKFSSGNENVNIIQGA